MVAPMHTARIYPKPVHASFFKRNTIMSNSPMNTNEKKVSGNEAQTELKKPDAANAAGNAPKDANAKPDASAQKADAAKTDANASVKKAS
jgi:hypothetical protein